ncbi:hypothetical protein Leryth_016187 [Lithospermum erythrorhizon]|nr:hypothetical protein Leryth_016187 [Lithospermum erythrorhizon]
MRDRNGMLCVWEDEGPRIFITFTNIVLSSSLVVLFIFNCEIPPSSFFRRVSVFEFCRKNSPFFGEVLKLLFRQMILPFWSKSGHIIR